MKKALVILLSAVLVWPVSAASAQGTDNPWVQQFKNYYFQKSFRDKSYQQIFLEESMSGDAYDFMNLGGGIDALTAMYITTGDDVYKKDCMTLIDNVTNHASRLGALEGKNDKFLGWVSTNANRTDVAGKDVVLFEGYLFNNVVRFLYTLKTNDLGSLSAADKAWYNSKLAFVEQNVWLKWIDRGNSSRKGPYANFLRNRTHMSAHWASIGLMLEKISGNSQIRRQGREVYTAFDKMLRRNMKPSSINNSAYQWNQTWDDSFGLSIPQDVSHGNHVVDYIVTAVQLKDRNWTVADLKALANTVKFVTYDQANNRFFDNVNRSPIKSSKNAGEFQAWGWVKLGRYDESIQQLYANWIQKDPRAANRFTQAAQLFANLALNEKMLHSR